MKIPKHKCLICGQFRPISHTVIWRKGKVVGKVCASHTLKEVIFTKKYFRKTDEVIGSMFSLKIEILEE